MRRGSALALAICLASSGVPIARAAREAEVVRTGFVDASGAKLYYEASGRGPHVVLISGGSAMDVREWDGQFLALARRYQILRYDPRGIGRSDPVSGPFSHVEDLLRVLDEHRIDKAHLVGLSFAAGVAIDFALVHPERVSSLVLISPTLGGHAFSKEYQERSSALMRVLRNDGPKAYAQATLKDPHIVPAGGRRKARKLLESNAARLLALDPTLVKPIEPAAAERLGEIHAPTLVLLGEQDHPEALALGERIASGIPGAQKILLTDAGRTLVMERPGKVNKILKRFFEPLTPTEPR